MPVKLITNSLILPSVIPLQHCLAPSLVIAINSFLEFLKQAPPIVLSIITQPPFAIKAIDILRVWILCLVC